uniref:Uncharacterized protein n=1 Tax=Manihot esculenta TaxID=3983 RepID=A0A2C9UL69_MANES
MKDAIEFIDLFGLVNMSLIQMWANFLQSNGNFISLSESGQFILTRQHSNPYR